MATPGAASDQPAFEARVRRDARALLGLALAVLRDTQEAEDAVQDTMELAWRSWRSLHDEEQRTARLDRSVYGGVCTSRRGLVRRLFLSATNDGGRTWKPIGP